MTCKHYVCNAFMYLRIRVSALFGDFEVLIANISFVKGCVLSFCFDVATGRVQKGKR